VRISVSQRLKPFSHLPGASCLIPGTSWEIQAFPAFVRIGKKYDLHLHVQGPVKGFTLEQDLEKNCVWIFGRAQAGFYRLKIQAHVQGIEVKVANAPKEFSINGDSLRPGEILFFSDAVEFNVPTQWERLFLGASKAQEWDLVWKRFDLKEILPVLYGLGQKVPSVGTFALKGTGRLLERGDWEGFCRAGFSQILIPRIFDDQYQGLAPIEASDMPPCFLLQEAALRLRALFFRQEGNLLFLLPACSFDAGRMVRVSVASFGELDLEWASHTLRRAILRASHSGDLQFHLPKGLSSFRIRTSPSQKGKRHIAREPFSIEAGTTYFFDCFHK
jgi:hypothetical protein